MTRLAEKVALVTGGTAGIGRATALALAGAGAAVALSGRRAAEGAAVVDLIRGRGGRALFIRGDVSLEEDVEAMIRAVTTTFGRLDIAVNNAGIEGDVGPRVQDVTVANYRAVTDTNVLGTLLCMKHEIPALLSAGGGSIVNISSIAGLAGFTGGAAYVASKHAVIGLTRAAALEYAKQNIRVNVVAPGAVQTDMIDRIVKGRPGPTLAAHPVGRFGTPEEIAAAILWLAGPESSFVTGAVLPADGGYTAQ